MNNSVFLRFIFLMRITLIIIIFCSNRVHLVWQDVFVNFEIVFTGDLNISLLSENVFTWQVLCLICHRFIFYPPPQSPPALFRIKIWICLFWTTFGLAYCLATVLEYFIYISLIYIYPNIYFNKTKRHSPANATKFINILAKFSLDFFRSRRCQSTDLTIS